MNKLFIVLLAICLVSVHAFVKREAPQAAASNDVNIEEMKQKITELAGDFSKKISEALNPDTVKENFNKIVDTITSAAQNLQPKPAAPAQ